MVCEFDIIWRNWKIVYVIGIIVGIVGGVFIIGGGIVIVMIVGVVIFLFIVGMMIGGVGVSINLMKSFVEFFMNLVIIKKVEKYLGEILNSINDVEKVF